MIRRNIWSALLGAAMAMSAFGGDIILATRSGNTGNLIRLDHDTFQATAAYRPGYWPAIASVLPLSDGNLAVIPYQDDAQQGNRATVHLVDLDAFTRFGRSGVVNAYTHTSTVPATQGGASGGTVNRFGEIFLFAPCGRFSNFDGAVTINGLDANLPPIEKALDGHYEIFAPDASSALSNGDWVMVMNNKLAPKDKMHVPGHVEIRGRHDLKTRLTPACKITGLPILTASAVNKDDRILVGDVQGNVHELGCNENRHISITATRERVAGRDPVTRIRATPEGDWVVAFASVAGDAGTAASGSVWVLEQGTLAPLHRAVGLAPVTALAVDGNGGILAGTRSGALIAFDSALSKRRTQADGFDAISHIVLPAASDGIVKQPEVTAVQRPARTVARHPDWVNALAPKGDAGPPITLARDGQTDYFIVCAADPTSQDLKAAGDLARWLNDMTGATFQMLQEGRKAQQGYTLLGVGRGVETGADPKKFISIGDTRLATQGREPPRLEEEGYEIRMRGDALVLRGGARRGPITAVYALLEEDLGCRWYTAGATSIPHRPTLAFAPVPRVYAPAMNTRRDVHYTEANHGDWSLRNRLLTINVHIPDEWGGYERPVSGFTHTFDSLLPKSAFEAHPEYFMVKDGERNAHQLCLTHPDVRKIIIDKTLHRLRADPSARIVDVSPNDGGGTCACGPCKAIADAEGSNMGPLLDLVNAVADAIAEDHPQVRVTTLAYLDTKKPPKNMRPRDNVVFWLATDDHNWEYLLLYIWETPGFQEALKGWQAIGANMVIWDYPIDYHNYIKPLPNMPLVAPNMRFYAEHGASGIFQQAQHRQTYGVDRSLLRSWVWAKQMWDLSRETQPLIRDFNLGFYGKAAEPMQAYDDMLWTIWERMHEDPEAIRALHKEHGATIPHTEWGAPDFVEDATALLARADELAGDDAELLDRIALAKLPILFLKIEEGPGDDPAGYLALVDEFEGTAVEHNVENIVSGLRDPTRDAIIAEWRARVAE